MSATELDVCMDLLDVVIDTTNARAELTGLRSESQRRLEDLEAIEKKAIQFRSEVTRIRAENDDQAETILLLECEIDGLKQAVNEARQSMLCAMDALNMEGIGDSRVFRAMREWLAAHHPAPEQVTP